ncbi:MAG: hypothetical protein KGY80_04160, partial [Candidatus Thorarchaeota archaeon]|nr:hypothetical protein [Candidatus Thorarchaeota archaeon]
MRLKFSLLCLVGILLIVSFAGTVVDEGPVAMPSYKNQKVTASYAKHDPIIITSNADFESQEWPGNGTQEDPYLIEGL